MASASEKAARKSEAKHQQNTPKKRNRQSQSLEDSPESIWLKNAVAKITNGDKLLLTIDKLRSRKARPDTEHIGGYMQRNYHVNYQDCLACMRELVELEAVIGVDYKGYVSFRNAFTWAKIKSYRNRPENFLKLKFNQISLNNAFSDLVFAEPDYLSQGVPPNRLIDQMMDGYFSCPTIRRLAQSYLDSEVDSGNLVRLVSGNYCISYAPKENNCGGTNYKSKNTSSGSSSSNNDSPFKMYDPDDYTMDHDFSSKTSSRQKNDADKMKKVDYYEIIVGRNLMNENNRELNNGYYNDGSIKHNGKSLNGDDEEINNTYRKKSKAERKQRLCVRSDDSMDLMFNEANIKVEIDENDRLSDDGDCDPDAERSSANTSPTPSQTNAGSFRSARRKRARKVFDPSDNFVVKKKRGRCSNAVKAAMASTQQDPLEIPKVVPIKENIKNSHRQCNECSKDKPSEALMACRDCTVRVHPSCVYTPEEKVLKAHTSWQCDNCKSCTVCFETKQMGLMATCFNCNDSYHHTCHVPKIPSSKNKWFCSKCNPKPEKIVKSSNLNWIKDKLDQQLNNNNQNATSTIRSRDLSMKTDEINSKDGPEIDPNIPDTTDWNEEQVYKYFLRLFPTDADIFRNEKIDGTALQLLTRGDVLERFKTINFGSRIKMWIQIVILQKRRNWRWDYWM